MKKIALMMLTALMLMGCSSNKAPKKKVKTQKTQRVLYTVQSGKKHDRGFLLDNVLKTKDLGDIHFNLLLPKSYQTSKTSKWSLHIALPGWDGLYFQGVGEDLKNEYTPFESSKYKKNLIVASVQLDSWDQKSARQVIRLTEYLLSRYRIDQDRVYLTGYSAGGETLSRVLELRPDLYRAALFGSSKWDGKMTRLLKNKVRIYMFVAKNDSYYGSQPARLAYRKLKNLYQKNGLDEKEISDRLVLDVRNDAWFDQKMKNIKDMYATDYHGAGMLVAYDSKVMKWVFK